MTVRVRNNTPGPIFVDVPSERMAEDQVDPVAQVLANLNLDSVTAEDALRTLVGLEVARRQEQMAAQELARSARRRAKDTVDLLPAYHGEDNLEYINEVPDDRWRRVEKIPAIAARLAARQLEVVDYPQTPPPF